MKHFIIILTIVMSFTAHSQRMIERDTCTDAFQFRAYPRTDLSPVVGLNPCKEWYVQHSAERPDFDGRVYGLQSESTFTETASQYGTHIKICSVTYSLVRLPDSVIAQNVKNAAESYLSSHFTEQDINSMNSLGTYLTNQLLKNDSLTTEQAAQEAELEAVFLWYAQVRAEAQARADSVLSDSIIPTFDFTEKP